MSAHTVKSYDDQLARLSTAIGEMGVLVCDIITLSRKALDNPRDGAETMREQAQELSAEITRRETSLEHQATAILALRQPQADDLRFVISSIKIASYLARMGRHARSIVRRAVRIDVPLPGKTTKRLLKMTDVVLERVEEGLAAIRDFHASQTADIERKDDEIDDAYHKIFESILQEMAADPALIPSCTHVIFAAKNLERIGDYAASLSKTVHYIASGERVN